MPWYDILAINTAFTIVNCIAIYFGYTLHSRAIAVELTVEALIAGALAMSLCLTLSVNFLKAIVSN